MSNETKSQCACDPRSAYGCGHATEGAPVAEAGCGCGERCDCGDACDCPPSCGCAG